MLLFYNVPKSIVKNICSILFCANLKIMINLNSLLFICTLIYVCTADFCSYNFSLSELPNSIFGEVSHMLAGGLISEPSNCNQIPYSEENIGFYLYTRKSPSTPIKLTTQNTDILKGKNTVVLNHGFLCSYKNDLMPELKDAYLERYDANVIIIDWSFYSSDYYANCYCTLPKVADTVAGLLCKADSNLHVDITKLHILGHSMGGQLAGLIGQKIQDRCNKLLHRITGLDPAGPLYAGKDISKRLDASDAKNVIVIHTNMGLMGYAGNCGTLDFYPNMGIFQAGCSIFNSPASSFVDMVGYPVVCSHLRSVSYMIESLKLNNFKGKSCFVCGSCIMNPFSRTYATMGEDFQADKTPCSYYMDTNDEPPFGQG